MAYIDTKYLGQCETCRHYDEKLKKCKGGMFFCDSGESYSPNMFKIATADVAEVKHGEWDNSGRYKFADGSLAIRCSECGCALHSEEYKKYHWNFCPNCGAKMDGERRET